MKKLLCKALAFILILPLLLCSCRDGQPTASQPSTASDVSFYAQVLQDYETIVRFRLSDTFEDDWNNDRFPTVSDALTLAIQENPNAQWSNALIEMPKGLAEPTAASFGYILRDINGDDFPELFWIRADYSILAIFTKQNEKLALLDVFWPKHEGVMTDGNELYIKNSSGVHTDYMLYTLSPQGTLLKTKHFGIDGVSAEAQPLYYEMADDEKQSIEVERFEALLTEHPFEFGSDWQLQEMNYWGKLGS